MPEELVKIMLQSGKSGLDLALYTLLFARSAGDEGIGSRFRPGLGKGTQIHNPQPDDSRRPLPAQSREY